MPERHINAAIEHIDTAAEDIEALVARVEGLQTSRRRLRLVLALVVVSVLIAGSALAYVSHRSNEDRVATCRDSNTRFDQLLSVVTPAPGSERDTPQARAMIADMRRVSVIDCNRDGDLADDISTTED